MQQFFQSELVFKAQNLAEPQATSTPKSPCPTAPSYGPISPEYSPNTKWVKKVFFIQIELILISTLELFTFKKHF